MVTSLLDDGRPNTPPHDPCHVPRQNLVFLPTTPSTTRTVGMFLSESETASTVGETLHALHKVT